MALQNQQLRKLRASEQRESFLLKAKVGSEGELYWKRSQEKEKGGPQNYFTVNIFQKVLIYFRYLRLQNK